MGAEAEDRQFVRDTPAPGVRVVRLARPDVRARLDTAAMADAPLAHEFEAALAGLAPGDAVVLNLGLLEVFVSAVFRFLLHANAVVVARGGRLLLCGLTPNSRQAYDLMSGDKAFPGQLRKTEAEAVAAARV